MPSKLLMNKQAVIEQIIETGIVPVIRASSANEASRIIEAIRAGGINIFEITMTVPGAVGIIEKLANEFGDTALIGAGTVLTPEQAGDCINAGARFVISPALNFETITFCRNLEITIIPGALTPTEIVAAWNAGASIYRNCRNGTQAIVICRMPPFQWWYSKIKSDY